MDYISNEMPKDPNKKTVQAHLAQDEYEAYRAAAAKRQWSDKKLNENIIRWFLQMEKDGKGPKWQ